jgi:hypothetical protein
MSRPRTTGDDLAALHQMKAFGDRQEGARRDHAASGVHYPKQHFRMQA